MVELLWVITIISVLAAGVMMGLGAARRGVMRAKAETQAKQVANAFIAYYHTYGRWPGGNNSGIVDWNCIDPLVGGNPKNIIFLEMKLDNTTTNGMWQMIDPWKNLFQFRAALNGLDGAVTPDPFTGSGALNVPVAIWSAGPDKQTNSAGYVGVNADNPKNW